MAVSPNTPTLPEFHPLPWPAAAVKMPLSASLRALVERRIERLIALLDELDGDPDLEPTFGAPEARGTPCIEVGRWMADQVDRLGDDTAPELHRVPQLSQAHWAEAAEMDEREEDDPAEEDDPREYDGDEQDTSCSEDDLTAWEINRHAGGRDFDWRGEQQARDRTAAASQAILDDLRRVQHRLAKQPSTSKWSAVALDLAG